MCLIFRAFTKHYISYDSARKFKLFNFSLFLQILFTEFVDWALEKNLDLEDDVEPEAAPAPEAEAEAAPAEEAPAAAEEAPAAEAEGAAE